MADSTVDIPVDWTLLKSGPTTGQRTVDWKGYAIEITTASTTPDESTSGRRVGPGGRAFTLTTGENLYGRLWRGLSDGEAAKIIIN